MHHAWQMHVNNLSSLVCSRERGIKRSRKGREEDAAEREGMIDWYLSLLLESYMFFFPINITLLTARLRMASNDHWIGRSGRRRWKGWRRRSGRRYGATRASWWPRRWRPTARSPPPASPCRKWRMSSSEHCYYWCLCVCVRVACSDYVRIRMSMLAWSQMSHQIKVTNYPIDHSTPFLTCWSSVLNITCAPSKDIGYEQSVYVNKEQVSSW